MYFLLFLFIFYLLCLFVWNQVYMCGDVNLVYHYTSKERDLDKNISVKDKPLILAFSYLTFPTHLVLKLFEIFFCALLIF